MQDYLKFQIGTALVKDGVCKLPYASIIEALTPAYFPEHYRFGGVAHPGTSPGKIFGPTMYVAVDVGVYNGFSNHSVGMNEIALFTSSDGGVWDKWVVVSDCCDDINYPVEPTPPTPPTPGPDLSEPFTIEAKEDNTPILALFLGGDTRTLLCSVDKGETWQSVSVGPTPAALALLNAGDTIQLKGDNICPGGMVAAASISGGGPVYKPIYAYGNIMSLLAAEGFEDLTEVPENAFSQFFADSLVDIRPEHPLLLPATTLSFGCYSGLFKGCISLTSAPELPATTLAESCYGDMFDGCISLTSAPELPATTLAGSCYSGMFRDCTSLTTAPELPATTLPESCYEFMFEGCISLTSAPELPATTLSESCYYSIFRGCTSLTTAPELPATTLSESCYYEMFKGCINLSEVKCNAEDISAQYCVNDWLKDVAASGTFTKKTGVAWPSGASGIPEGWSVVEV